MTHNLFDGTSRRLLAVVLAVSLCGCKDERVSALAGTYVTEHNESGFHSRMALTLRDDNHWTSASEEIMGGKDLLAGGREGDAMVPPGYVDSGTFALKGVVLAVNSAKDGVRHYTVNGDTLWNRGAAMSALATAVTGVAIQGGSEGFLVRQR